MIFLRNRRVLLWVIVFIFTATHDVFAISDRDSLLNKLAASSQGERVIILAEIGNTYYPAQMDMFGTYLDSANSEVDTSSDRKGLARIHHLYGKYYARLAKWDSSLVFFNKSIEINQLIKDELGIAEATAQVGLVHLRSGRYDQASVYIFEAIQIAERIGHNKTVALCYENLGHLNYNQKKFQDALEYHKKARMIYRESGNMRGVATTAVNMGSALHQQLKYDSALYYLNQALDYFVDEKDTLSQSYPYNNIALILSDQKKYSESNQYLEKGLEIRIKYNEPRGICYGYNFIGLNNQLLGNYRNAIENYEKAVKYAVPINYLILLRTSYEGLAASYDSLRNYGQAYKYQRLYSTVSDSLFSEQKTKELIGAQTKYETEKKEQQIVLLNTQNDLQAATIQRNNLILLGAIILIILIIVLGVSLLRQRDLKARARLEEEKSKLKSDQIRAVISSQEKERKRFAMDLHDGFGQLLSALKLNVYRIGDLADDHGELAGKFEEILNTMYSSLKGIAFDLMPHTLFEKGLEGAINELKDQINGSGTMKLDFQSFGIGDRINNEQKVAIYRIIQEVVNNILKHSNAAKINISFTDLGNSISLLIEDDGDGFDQISFINSKGNGWKNIKSRLDMLHGDIEMDTMVGRKNTTISIEIAYVQELQSEIAA